MPLIKEDPTKDQFEEFYAKPNPWNADGSFSDYVRQKILNYHFSESRFKQGIDIACGEGFMTARMEFVENMTGIDISEKAISRASSAYADISFLSGDGFKDKIIDGKFDFVSCFEALYYPSSLKDRKQALANIYQYGTDEASFVFSVVTIGENEHRKYFTKDEFMNLLTEAGFEVEVVCGFVLGGKKGSSIAIRIFRKVLETLMPRSLSESFFAKITMYVSDDFIYQHLFICKKRELNNL